MNPTHTVVMTGVSSGIGRRAALEVMARAPEARLVVLARTDPDGLAGALNRESGTETAFGVHADMSSVASLRHATGVLSRRFRTGELPPLRAFGGNAGTQLTSASTESVDGFEQTFAVNVLANHVLIERLLDDFGGDARIVITTSDTHFGDFRHTFGTVPAPVWRETGELARAGTAKNAAAATAGRTAYSTSKLAVIYLVHAYARRLPNNVSIYAFNPGLVPGTGLARDADPVTRFAFRHLMPALTSTPLARSVTQSGKALASALLDRSPIASGSYLNGERPERSSGESYDEDREEALWRELTRMSAATHDVEQTG